jgi:hypothetical protein
MIVSLGLLLLLAAPGCYAAPAATTTISPLPQCQELRRGGGVIKLEAGTVADSDDAFSAQGERAAEAVQQIPQQCFYF